MRLLQVVVLVTVAVALAGCAAFGPTPSVRLVCAALAFPDAVAGQVHVTSDETWLEADDGGHISVVWPAEVDIRPDGLYSRETGERMVRDGERLRLIQTPRTSAAGTQSDPYRPGWCSFYEVF